MSSMLEFHVSGGRIALIIDAGVLRWIGHKHCAAGEIQVALQHVSHELMFKMTMDRYRIM
jgi:hypothetical protein